MYHDCTCNNGDEIKSLRCCVVFSLVFLSLYAETEKTIKNQLSFCNCRSTHQVHCRYDKNA